MSNQNIANAAIKSINDQRHAEATSKARGLILAIGGLNVAIAARQESITKMAAELKKLANDTWNAVEITGTMPDTISAKTVIETIAELNKEEQGRVAESVRELDINIRDAQSLMDADISNRAELRKKLAAITVEEVTTATING